MKKLITVFALFITVATNAQSSDTTTGTNKLKAIITICDKDPQKVMIVVSNPTGEKLSIEVYNSAEGYLLQKTTRVNDYRANLDFSTAADGEYIVEVSCRNNERIRKTVRMETRESVIRTASLR